VSQKNRVQSSHLSLRRQKSSAAELIDDASRRQAKVFNLSFSLSLFLKERKALEEIIYQLNHSQ